MTEITLKVDGMACGMCESHINDTIRKNFVVKKVTSSHKKGECVIESEGHLDEGALHAAIDPTGYTLVSVTEGAVEKKGGLFHRK